MMYRHGLRVSEAIRMRAPGPEPQTRRVWIRRLKNGPVCRTIGRRDELRAIKRYLHTRHDALPWLFLSERGAADDPTIGQLPHSAPRPGVPDSVRFIPTCCGIRAGFTWRMKAAI